MVFAPDPVRETKLPGHFYGDPDLAPLWPTLWRWRIDNPDVDDEPDPDFPDPAPDFVLLIADQQDGRWALPGGHVHDGQEPTAAAVRELNETTAIGLDPARLTVLGTSRDWDPDGEECVTTRYTASLPARLHLSPHGAARWHPVRALPPLAPGHAKMIQDALEDVHIQ
ncbi:NUDIX domain-containing protein [Streptomyces sp. NPDC049879]|uniref:NUDIX domain-containing protein n=1 Tax=Streptomyces sp. NPDC049879 TaxID=3365598 RepID=UPI00379A932B